VSRVLNKSTHMWVLHTVFATGCENLNQMKTKGKRLDGIVFTNADPQYAGKLDDPQGGDTAMLMQQVREVMSHEGQSRDDRRIKLDLFNVGEACSDDGVSVAVRVCE